jgi:tRNA pseudouridine38-40 synthase
MRFFAELSYLGTAYCGWQRQPDAPSVQGVLEDALSTLLREPVAVTGAGRTDTGVHASYYVAHFDAPAAPDIYHLNAILPPDIAVRRVWEVAPDAHARFDAREREYTYHITPHKDPFRQHTAWYYSGALDLDAMNRAASHLLGTHDFTTFSKLHSGNKTFDCTVFEARWAHVHTEQLSGQRTIDPAHFQFSIFNFQFTIRADRFLRNMVRATVGTLVDVGRGKITPERFAAILAARDRSLASGSAPAQGLFLSNIKY